MADTTSRRALLGMGMGALGGAIAGALARAKPVDAGGQPVYLGIAQLATASTTIINTANAQAVLVGDSESGDGVVGASDTGSGLYGVSTSGWALRTHGRLKIDTSGVHTIPPGSTSVTVEPGVAVTAGSFVLLTPRVNIGSGRTLWWTGGRSGSDTFLIRMSKPRTTATPVSWLLLG